jgi:hypothetical protein
VADSCITNQANLEIKLAEIELKTIEAKNQAYIINEISKLVAYDSNGQPYLVRLNSESGPEETD